MWPAWQLCRLRYEVVGEACGFRETFVRRWGNCSAVTPVTNGNRCEGLSLDLQVQYRKVTLCHIARQERARKGKHCTVHSGVLLAVMRAHTTRVSLLAKCRADSPPTQQISWADSISDKWLQRNNLFLIVFHEANARGFQLQFNWAAYSPLLTNTCTIRAKLADDDKLGVWARARRGCVEELKMKVPETLSGLEMLHLLLCFGSGSRRLTRTIQILNGGDRASVENSRTTLAYLLKLVGSVNWPKNLRFSRFVAGFDSVDFGSVVGYGGQK